jgi:hypothetical protein
MDAPRNRSKGGGWARRRRRARRAVAPIIIAAIIAAAILGGTTAYFLTKPASEAPLTPAGSDYILASVTVAYTSRLSLGLGAEYYDIQVHLNQSLVGSGPVDIYVLVPKGDGDYEVVASETKVSDGDDVKAPITDTSKPIYVLAAWKAPQYGGVMVDAIIVLDPPDTPGRIVESSTHCWEDSVPYEYRIHPNFLAQHVKVKISYWNLVWEQWGGAWGLASALKFTGTVVFTMLPYAGSLWLIWFVSAVIRAVGEYSAEPIMDFFYKNYQIIKGIYSLILNVVLKLIDLLTGPAT